jgi:CrcB protein
MARLLAIFFGGGIGAVLRYLLQGFVQERAAAARGWAALFPWGTLAVNLSGCFAIGLLAGLFESRWLAAPTLRSFVLIGVLGGFTTFSTFGFETFALARAGGWVLALGNVAASVLLGLAGVALGAALARLA